MGHKLNKKKKNQEDDCFGKYDPNFNVSVREESMYAFGCDVKPWNKPQKDDTLGPGYYEVHEKKNFEAYTIGNQKRFKQQKPYNADSIDKNNSSRQGYDLNSTIGYMPSYLKNSKVSKLR